MPARGLQFGLVISAGLLLAAWLRFGPQTAVATNPPTHFSDVEHGFSLVFPSSWYGVQTLRVTSQEYDYVAFTHPYRLGEAGREGKLEFSVFVMDRVEEQPPAKAVELGERNGRRYAWLMTEAPVPSSLDVAVADMPGILSTFVTLTQ